MNREKTVWEENSPDSLLDICSRFVLSHPQTYCYQVADNNGGGSFEAGAAALPVDGPPPTKLALLPDLHLPTEICEKLFAMLHEEGLDVEDATASAFSDTETSRLRCVNVRGTSITDEGLLGLLKHNLRDLDVHGCHSLTKASLENINRHAESLVNLNIGNSVDILPDYIVTMEEVRRHEEEEDDDNDDDSLDEEDRTQRSIYDDRGYILKAPNLQRLNLRNLVVARGASYFDLLLKPLKQLTHLDISGARHNEGFEDFAFLRHLPRLVSLVLHDVDGIDKAVKNIAEMKNLR